MSLIDFIRFFYFPQEVLDILTYDVIDLGYFKIDIWTLPHFMSGILLGLFIRRKDIIVVLLVLFEIFENLFLAPKGAALLEPVLNSIFDVIIGLVGTIIVHKLLEKRNAL